MAQVLKRPALDEPGSSVPAKVAKENGAEEARPAAQQPKRKIVILYRDTEPLSELQKHWLPETQEQTPVQLEVLIQPEYLNKDIRKIKTRQIWGDLIYTHDSDLVAVLMHMGYYTASLAHAPTAIVEARATIKLLPPQTSYPTKQRFIKSRSWNNPGGLCSYTVERCWLVTRNGSNVELAMSVDQLPAPMATVQPQSSDRHITTRNTGAKGKQMPQEVSVQYNLCNEPWLRYTLAAVADKGLKPSQWTSACLIDSVLFLETSSSRYQVSRSLPTEDASGSGTPVKEMYVFARCKAPLPSTLMHRVGVPLPAHTLEVVQTGVDWEELQWGTSQLHLRGHEYQLKRLHFQCHLKASTENGAGAA